jgi:pimeloyl-ACP methyl ester carboxylesterase
MGSTRPTAQAEGTPVQLLTEDGVPLAASYYEPTRSSAPGVVLFHMLTRTRHDWDDLAARLHAEGFAVLSIDLRGHGESGVDPSGSQADLLPMRLDAKAARLFLKAQPGVDSGRLAMVGASIGANLAAIDASTDPAVRTVVLLSAGLDYRNLRTDGALRAFGNRPALLVASSDDAYALRSAWRLASAGEGPRQVHVVDNAGHGTVMLNRAPDLLPSVVDWLRTKV